MITLYFWNPVNDPLKTFIFMKKLLPFDLNPLVHDLIAPVKFLE